MNYSGKVHKVMMPKERLKISKAGVLKVEKFINLDQMIPKFLEPMSVPNYAFSLIRKVHKLISKDTNPIHFNKM